MSGGEVDPVDPTGPVAPLPLPLPPPLAVRPALTDRGAVAVAVAVWVGAWVHRPVPLAMAIVVVMVAGTAAASRRAPVVPLALAGLVAASVLGVRAWAGLAPAARAPYRGTVTLVADPSVTPYGAHVDVRLGRRRLELWASNGAAGAVQQARAGERVQVQGRVGPAPPGSSWLVPRHVAGRLTVTSAERAGAGSWPWRAANRFRRLLERGIEPLGDPAHSLYLGFVLGDDRNQPPEIVDDFRGSGLSHLLVVSGENVAFMLTLASPVLGRLAWRARWATTIGLLVAFGVVTRFEPSVLRAVAMAAISVSAGAVGRPAGAVRTLALAVVALVLVDPLLVWSVGFQLSVAASFAIAVASAPIAAALPGPKRLAELVSVTAAAQVGVAPVLLPRFGGLPVVSLAANVVAVPVAGLVTTWGLPAGVVAGLAGGPVAALVHLPTRVCIWWVASVARAASSLPLGELGWPHVLVLVVAAGSWVLVRSAAVGLPGAPAAATVAGVRAGAAGAVVVALLSPAVVLRHPPPVVPLGGGVKVERTDGRTVVQVGGHMSLLDLLQGLRRAGVRRVDVLRVKRGDPDAVARAIAHRWPVGHVEVAQPP